MKKTMRILAVSVLMVVMIASMSMSAFATRDVNYTRDNAAEPDQSKADILVLSFRESRDLKALLQGDWEGRDITWASTDDRIATVSNDGIVKAYSKGTVYVTASYTVADGQSEFEYFYISSVNNVQNDYGVVKLHVGESINVADLFTPAISERTFTGATSNPLIVSVNYNTGVVTAKEVGIKTVTANFVDANGDRWAFPLRVEVID